MRKSTLVKPQRAVLGSKVRLLGEDSRFIEVQLVTKEEVDLEANKISVESPLGNALLNKEQGDQIEILTPSGSLTFTILEIST